MKSGCRSCALAAASSSALGINHRKITHTSTSRSAMPVRSSVPIALRYSASIRAWAHTKLIRQIVLTVKWTELKSSHAASFVMPAAANPRRAVGAQFRRGSRWPPGQLPAQDASVTTAEPAIAVARDQIIDRVADHPWDELEDPCPLPARKLARNAQHGFGFYIGLAARQEGKGIRVIRIDAELLSERTSLGQLDRNEAKIAAAITFAHEAAAARAQDAYAVEQDQAVRRVDAARTFWINND